MAVGVSTANEVSSPGKMGVFNPQLFQKEIAMNIKHLHRKIAIMRDSRYENLLDYCKVGGLPHGGLAASIKELINKLLDYEFAEGTEFWRPLEHYWVMLDGSAAIMRFLAHLDGRIQGHDLAEIVEILVFHVFVPYGGDHKAVEDVLDVLLDPSLAIEDSLPIVTRKLNIELAFIDALLERIQFDAEDPARRDWAFKAYEYWHFHGRTSPDYRL